MMNCLPYVQSGIAGCGGGYLDLSILPKGSLFPIIRSIYSLNFIVTKKNSNPICFDKDKGGEI
jgi:hypothetical protein